MLGCENVFETYVKGGVGVGVECVAGFAGDVAGTAVVVADCVFDLWCGISSEM